MDSCGRVIGDCRSGGLALCRACSSFSLRLVQGRHRRRCKSSSSRVPSGGLRRLPSPWGPPAKTAMPPSPYQLPDSGFSVHLHAQTGFHPVTVPVQVTRIPGRFSPRPASTDCPIPIQWSRNFSPAGPPPKGRAENLEAEKSRKKPKGLAAAPPAGGSRRSPQPPQATGRRRRRRRPHRPADGLHRTRQGADCSPIASCIDCGWGTLLRILAAGVVTRRIELNESALSTPASLVPSHGPTRWPNHQPIWRGIRVTDRCGSCAAFYLHVRKT